MSRAPCFRATLWTALVVSSSLGCGSDEGESGGEGAPGGAGGAGGAAGSRAGSGASASVSGSSGGSSSTAGSGGGATTACLPALASCDVTAECCGGSLCFEGKCRETCETGADCGSLCCVDNADAGGRICSEASLCPTAGCSEEGGGCDQPGQSCCDALMCVGSSTDGLGGCRERCDVEADCASGCCMPLPGATTGFCAASSFCGCAGVDETCGGSSRCCSGHACTTIDSSGAFGCRPTCSGDADCGSGCCLTQQGTGVSVCIDGVTCN